MTLKSSDTESQPALFPALLTDDWRHQAFDSFRDGVEICLLRDEDPRIALLKYSPGATVPMHRHTGLEMIQVLDGAQSDEHGTYRVGDVVVNAVGSRHSVWSDEGCVVLILWEKPVVFEG